MDKIKILVIDNDVGTLSKIYFNLLFKNYRVEICNDQREIIPRVQRLRPHIVFVNLQMTQTSGEEICRNLKKHSSTPVVLIQPPGATPSTKINGCHADEVIFKPINLTELNQIIVRWTSAPVRRDRE